MIQTPNSMSFAWNPKNATRLEYNYVECGRDKERLGYNTKGTYVKFDYADVFVVQVARTFDTNSANPRANLNGILVFRKN